MKKFDWRVHECINYWIAMILMGALLYSLRSILLVVVYSDCIELCYHCRADLLHHTDIIMSAMASQFTRLTIVYSTVYSGADQIKHQSSASLAFVREIHRWPVNSPYKGPVMRKMFPFDDVIMFDSESTGIVWLLKLCLWVLKLIEAAWRIYSSVT